MVENNLLDASSCLSALVKIHTCSHEYYLYSQFQKKKKKKCSVPLCAVHIWYHTVTHVKLLCISVMHGLTHFRIYIAGCHHQQLHRKGGQVGSMHGPVHKGQTETVHLPGGQLTLTTPFWVFKHQWPREWWHCKCRTIHYFFVAECTKCMYFTRSEQCVRYC